MYTCLYVIFFLLEPTRCLVLCKGTITTKAVDQARGCVGYDISFNLNESLTTKLKDFQCKIPNCSVEVVKFVCTFNSEYDDISLNITSSNENGGNRSCLGNLISKRLILKKLIV